MIELRPFLGTIGMPTAELGEQSAWLPRRTGGNMDCKELVAGTTLYLPIDANPLAGVHAALPHGAIR